jgi:hypothetical protein
LAILLMAVIHLFRQRVKSYIENLISGPHKPRRVLVCMIYYPGIF